MSKSVGIVSDIKGLVNIEVDGSQRELKARDPISENGAILTTTEFSNITISFDDGREVTIGPNQEITLDETFFENETYDNDDITFLQNTVDDITDNQIEINEEIESDNENYADATSSSGDVETEQLDVNYIDNETPAVLTETEEIPIEEETAKEASIIEETPVVQEEIITKEENIPVVEEVITEEEIPTQKETKTEENKDSNNDNDKGVGNDIAAEASGKDVRDDDKGNRDVSEEVTQKISVVEEEIITEKKVILEKETEETPVGEETKTKEDKDSNNDNAKGVGNDTAAEASGKDVRDDDKGNRSDDKVTETEEALFSSDSDSDSISIENFDSSAEGTDFTIGTQEEEIETTLSDLFDTNEDSALGNYINQENKNDKTEKDSDKGKGKNKEDDDKEESSEESNEIDLDSLGSNDTDFESHFDDFGSGDMHDS